MKNVFYTLVFLFFSGAVFAQQNEFTVTKGELLTIGTPTVQGYQHIHFPKKNRIIKRGAIADFKQLVNKTLVVHSIETNKGGAEIVTLKRKDGLNFFRFFPEVQADITAALESGELKTVPYKGSNAIAQQ